MLHFIFHILFQEKIKISQAGKTLKYVGNDRKRSSRAQNPLMQFLDFLSRRMKLPKSFYELSSVEGLEGPTLFLRKQSADFFFFSPKNCGLHSSADFIFFFSIRPKQTLQFGVIFQLRDTSLVAFNKNCHILAFSLVFCLFLPDATSITVGRPVA